MLRSAAEAPRVLLGKFRFPGWDLQRRETKAMTATFLHPADWQLGKPFARIADPQKQALVQPYSCKLPGACASEQTS